MKKSLRLALCCISFSGYLYAENVLSSEPTDELLVQAEQDEQELTLLKRIEYFGKGLGYGALCGAALFGIRHCFREIGYRMERPDHVKKLLDLCDTYKVNPDPNELAEAHDACSVDRNVMVLAGTLSVGISYLLLKHNIPQKSYENLRKAFQ